jgi:PKD repeat protein
VEKKSIIVVILLVIATIILPCAEVTIAAQTTINMGSINLHGPTNNPSVVCSPNNYDIKVRPTGNTITIQVAYSMSCPGTADDGYCDISFVGGGGSDSRHTGESDSGILTISKFMNPGDTFQVKLHAKYTDMYGGITLGEDTQYASGTVSVPPAPVAGFSFSPSNPTTENTNQFTDLSTATGSTIISWSWSFGDGASSTDKSPTYQYQKSGTYPVTLQVTDDYGVSNTKTSTITIKDKSIVPGVPCFELITLIFAIFLGIILLNRKRK